MRICFVTSSFPQYKGDYAGLCVFEKALALSNRHEVHVIYPASRQTDELEEEPFIRHPLPYPFKTYPLAQVHGLDLLKIFNLLVSMAREIRHVKSKHQIDLFYAFWTIPSAFICSLSCGKTPYLTEVLGSDVKVFGRRGLARPFISYSLKQASKVVALSNELKREAIELGAGEEKVLVIPPGIDMNKFSPMDKHKMRATLNLPDGLLLLYVGSLFKVKRVDRILNAGAHLGRDFDFHLLIIGDGPERQGLESMANSFGMQNTALFMGAVSHDQIPLYMAASDILLLLSETEGLPKCVQESMASCVPVVVSNVGGLPDIIINGVSGYLVNDENEVIKALVKLMSSPALRSELGLNARSFAHRYLSSVIVYEQINELCESIARTNYEPATKSFVASQR